MNNDKKDEGKNVNNDDSGKTKGEGAMNCSACGGTMRKESDKWVCQDCKHEMPA